MILYVTPAHFDVFFKSSGHAGREGGIGNLDHGSTTQSNTHHFADSNKGITVTTLQKVGFDIQQ